MTIPAPEFEFVVEHEWDAIMDSFPSKMERRLRHPKKIRRFFLEWSNAKKSERDQILADFDATLGGATTFSYTPVDSVTPVNVRFDSDSFNPGQANAVRYEIRIVLIEEVF